MIIRDVDDEEKKNWGRISQSFVIDDKQCAQQNRFVKSFIDSTNRRRFFLTFTFSFFYREEAKREKVRECESERERERER